LNYFCVFPLFKELHGHTVSKVAESNAWNLLGCVTTDINLQWKRIIDICKKTARKLTLRNLQFLEKMIVPQPAKKFPAFYGNYYYYYYYYYLLQLSVHSVAVVLTQVTNKNKYT